VSKNKAQKITANLCIIEDCTYDELEESLCSVHIQSKERLEESFISWKRAYDNEITWEAYLKFIVENPTGTVGKYNQEMAQFLLDDTIEEQQ
jgi:hypothetical protein